MYDLHLTAEQLEIRDTVRDFVEQEIKPVVLHPDRLQDLEWHLPLELVDKAAQLGLRTLALSEEAGGAGADSLTACIVLEELAAGDAGIAVTLAETARLARILFDEAMTPAQRSRFLPRFVADDRYHLALAGPEHDAELGWGYHRSTPVEPAVKLSAARQGGDWVINGVASFVANAPLAKLFAVQVRTASPTPGTGGVSTLLVPRDTRGLAVRDHRDAAQAVASDGRLNLPWYHGTRGELTFKDCRVPADHLLGKEGDAALMDELRSAGRGTPQLQAINLGIGRAALEAGVGYAKLRVQGGRPIVEHQAIGTILAEAAVRLTVARSIIWQAAWAADHPDAYSDRSLPDLPLQTVAKVFTSKAVHEATELAAECFGAMGVMRDMPLHKYLHDALVFVHSETSNSVAKFRIAEALAGYERPSAHDTVAGVVRAAAA
jgi:alkylation response protein AidB-like acyl-CoA dehydrogenase